MELVTKRGETGATAFDIETELKIAGRPVATARCADAAVPRG